jgi:KamA family protein
MYCRFCFRKSLLNELKTDMFSGSLTEALQYIEGENEVEEVIFSGGDPFMVGEEVMKQVLKELEKISHLKRVRFHTRVPVTLPAKVTPSFVEALGSSRFTPVVVTHFNHPKEITQESTQAISLLKKKTFLLNQSVLLNRVNNSADILVELSQKLFEMGILPYYIHQLDPSEGTQSFQVDVEEGKRIWNEIKKRLPGYLVPRYVVDIVGDPYKREVIALET